MRQPLWAINSSLLLFFVLGQLVFFLLYTPVPRRVSLEPDVVHLSNKKVGVVVSIKNIYEQNDLFGTYISPAFVAPAAIEPTVPVIPEVPANIPLKIPIEPEKVFIAPLAVNLKGVMYGHDRPEQSVAIIQFQDSKEEINYRVGQLINDAQILKIYPNRVIVVRSNGQQETLYLREDEAGKDFALEMAKEISGLVIPHQNGMYHIPVDKFVAQIKTLGQFIDLLDLTTVYQKGKSIGCRIGKAGKDSLASKLGLMRDDIVQQVNGLPVTDISSRVLVFDHVLQKKTGDVLSVQIDRGGKTTELKYVLSKMATPGAISDVAPVAKHKKTTAMDEQGLYNLEEQRKKMLEQKVKFAPTAHQIEMQERRKMFEARRREMLANRSASGGIAGQFVDHSTINIPTQGAKG